jgi:hypothetical protein
LGFSAHLGQKKILNFFHLENFLNSDIFGHMLIIVGHLGSFKGDWSKALCVARSALPGLSEQAGLLPVELGRQGSQALNLRVNKPAKLAFNNI